MTPFAERLLNEIRKLNGQPVRSGTLAKKLNCCRKTAYNYLRELESMGLAMRPSERLWCAA